MKKRLMFILLTLATSQVLADKRHTPFKSPIVSISDSSGELYYQKNTTKVVPIASITKLMLAVVVLESGKSLDDEITITKADMVSNSRLPNGTTLTRGQMLHLALMSSDNRAAHCVARTLTGTLNDTIQKMNDTAHRLGMNFTTYVEPTGLDARNKSTANDLAKLLVYANQKPIITLYSTDRSTVVNKKQFFNTNPYIRGGTWSNAVVSKTGFTNAAGRCITVSMSVGEKIYDIVILGSRNKKQRLTDLATARKIILASR